MTDSADDAAGDRVDPAARSGDDSRVPDDTGWTLETQVPVDEDGTHDLTSAIVVAVAAVEGISPLAIKEPPLYEVIDVVSLEEAFFGSPTIGRENVGHRSVEFMYRGHRVLVRSDAWIQVYSSDEA